MSQTWGSKAGRSKGRSGERDRDCLGAICMQNIETVSRWGMVIKTPIWITNLSLGVPLGTEAL